MDSNTKYLLRLWVIPLFFGALMLVGLTAAIRRGDNLVPIFLVIGAAIVAMQVWFTKRRTQKLFLAPTPETAIAHYRANIAKLPNGAALGAYMCGLAYAFYGEYDNAREELSSVTWSKLPPMYEGYRTYVLSVIAMLEKKDFEKALDLALEARELCNVSAQFPGAGSSKRTFDAHVLACELLARRAGENAVAKLEQATRHLSGTQAVLPAWTLAQYYSSIGQTDSASVHIAALRRLVPNCRPLLGTISVS